jgi:hypothetical protein
MCSAGHEAADVEEGQAPLVLLVGLGGLADDLWVEHDQGLGTGVGRDDDRGGAGDADLRSGDACALEVTCARETSDDGMAAAAGRRGPGSALTEH